MKLVIDQPLLIIHKSGHVAYFNSVLLSMINPSIIKGENNINTDKGIAYEIHAIMILLSYMLKYLHINNSTIKELTDKLYMIMRKMDIQQLLIYH